MDEIYAAALAEGGKLLVYAGGDTPDQQDGTKAAFESKFPGMTVDIIVDLSKYHGPRIDYQHETNSVIVDVAHLQTLQDFTRWKREGKLLQYKPLDWGQVQPAFKDIDGYYIGYTVFSFSNLINHQLLPSTKSTPWPKEAYDFLRPEFKDKLVISYPNDDDAILFWFYQIVGIYGWNFIDQLKQQNITLVRSTQYPYDFIAEGRFPLSFLTSGEFQPNENVTYYIPEHDPFISWPQTAAIFKAAPHPNSAKLYLNWLLSKENQENNKNWGWSVRRDANPPNGWKNIWEYRNTDPTAFGRFMEDRNTIEIFKNQICLIFGEVQGNSPTGDDLGTHPIKPIQPIPH